MTRYLNASQIVSLWTLQIYLYFKNNFINLLDTILLNHIWIKTNEDTKKLWKQLKNFKDNLKKCLGKCSSMKKSGAAAFSLPKCKYFDKMSFLHDKSCNRPSESNLQLQSTFIAPPPSPVYVNLKKKKKTNTVS